MRPIAATEISAYAGQQWHAQRGIGGQLTRRAAVKLAPMEVVSWHPVPKPHDVCAMQHLQPLPLCHTGHHRLFCPVNAKDFEPAAAISSSRTCVTWP